MRPSFPKSLSEPTNSSDHSGQGWQVAQGKLKPRVWGQGETEGILPGESGREDGAFDTCLESWKT